MEKSENGEIAPLGQIGGTAAVQKVELQVLVTIEVRKVL